MRVSEWSTDIEALGPKEGDLIEIKRTVYCHWVMYLGRGQVLHFTCEGDEICNALKIESLNPATVLKQQLAEIMGTSFARVNNKPDLQKNPKNIGAIRNLVRVFLKKPNDLFYNLKHFNCEHFVTFIKYGVPHSGQASIVNRMLVTTAAHSVVHYTREAFSDKKKESWWDVLKPMANSVLTAGLHEALSETFVKTRIDEKFEEFLRENGILHESHVHLNSLLVSGKEIGLQNQLEKYLQ